MTREEMFQDIESLTVGLDDTFKFHCTQCGKCCRNRDDILLSAFDIFKMSRYLKMNPEEFVKKYCNWYIGENSRIPIIRLNSVGKNYRCPLLRNNKCSVHAVKPAVCAMFPLGRYIAVNHDDAGEAGLEGQAVKYLLQDPECGDTSETHTVREWLTDFDIKTEDEAFMRWHTTLFEIGEIIRKLEKTEDMMTMVLVWSILRIGLYLNYDTHQDFLPQFEVNAKQCIALLSDIPKLKEMGQYAG